MNTATPMTIWIEPSTWLVWMPKYAIGNHMANSCAA
jgi:hypothetical protein